MVQFPRFSAVAALISAASLALPAVHADPEAHTHYHLRSEASTATPSGYSPAQIRHTYGVDQISGAGAGQTIAVIEAYGSPTIVQDVAIFSTTFGLPAAKVTVYFAAGKPHSTNAGWGLETSLDAEWAHAMAPAAAIAVVVAKSASTGDLLNAVDYAVKLGAHQISMSWGANEFSGEQSLDSHFSKPTVNFFASSGDSGSGVEWPAVSAYVTGVGGTSLVLDASGNVLSELAWSGSGGGISQYVTRPVYQNGWNNFNYRGVPDVSYSADPNYGFAVYDSSYNGHSGWLVVGGTSCGAPQWASILAVENSLRAQPISGALPDLYSLALTSFTGDYRDITSGSNGGYPASASYDFVTGLGSPIVNAIVPQLQAK